MAGEQTQRAYELFQSALKREPDERKVFLDEACAGDEGLRVQVEFLMAADAGAA